MWSITLSSKKGLWTGRRREKRWLKITAEQWEAIQTTDPKWQARLSDEDVFFLCVRMSVPGSYLADATLTKQLLLTSLGCISDDCHCHPAHLFQCSDGLPALWRSERAAIKSSCTFVGILDFCVMAMQWNASCCGDANPQVPTRGPSQTCVPSGLLWQHPRAHICQDMQRPRGSRCIHFTSRAHSGDNKAFFICGHPLISYLGWIGDSA